MKVFQLDLWSGIALLGSVAEDDGAFVSTFNIQAANYNSITTESVKQAFDYAVGLLKSQFTNVDANAITATVTYEHSADHAAPTEVVTGERIHHFLLSQGCTQKAN